MKERTMNEIKDEIENALLVVTGFREASEEDQDAALDVAAKCMKAVLYMMEGETA